MIIRIETVVQPGGRIEVTAPDLKPGQRVTVAIEMDGAEPERRPTAAEILAEMPGHLEFQTAAEVEEYLREERDSWDR